MQRIADLDRFSDLWYVMSIDHFAYALRHPSDRHSKLRVRSVYFPDCISQFNIFHIFSFLSCHLFGLLNDILFKFFCQPFCLLFLYKIVVAFLFTLLYYVDKRVIYMTFANNLKRLRTEANLTQEELASMIGTSKQAISRYERSNREPNIKTARLIAEALHVPLSSLVPHADVLHPAPSPAPADPEISSVLHRLNQPGRDAWMKYGRYLADQPEYAAPAQPEEPVLNLPKATRRRDGFTEIRVFDQPAAAGLGNYLDEPDFHVEQFPPGFIPAGADFGIRISGNSMEPEIPDGITVFVRSAPSIDPGRIGIFVLNGEAYCKKLIVDKTQRQLRLVSLNPAYQDIIVSESDVCRTVGQVIGKMM